jgi:multiple antibiotic resistance protein
VWWQRHLSEFVTLFLVVNPFAVLPTFLAIAATLGPASQRKLALNCVLVALAVLIFFSLAGAFLLEQMGVPIRAFQIAGGIVLFLVALDAIRGEPARVDPRNAEQSELAFAVYPLGIPKIAGPGAMLTVILLTDDDRFNLAGQVTTIGVIVLVLAVQLLLLLAAGPILRLIGTTGAGVISRVMGMLLAALAVSLILGAVGDWLNLPQL